MSEHHNYGTKYAGVYVSDNTNPAIQKAQAYRILSAKYEEKKEKYDTASKLYKQTAEYKRLEKIVLRLRAILNQMEAAMA